MKATSVTHTAGLPQERDQFESITLPRKAPTAGSWWTTAARDGWGATVDQQAARMNQTSADGAKAGRPKKATGLATWPSQR